jgi:hypothetical protein
MTSNHVAIGIASMLAACGSQAPMARSAPTTAGVPIHGFELPVVIENHRWFLQTKTADGIDLRLYLDSAGGMYLTKAAAERLKLEIRHVKTEEREMDAVPFPRLADPRIPRPKIDPFPVLPKSPFDGDDGMLGAFWFAGHTFTFDYPNQRLVLCEQSEFPEVPAEHVVAIGFPRDAKGGPTMPYGRIPMIVDGKTFDMLFDTGATVDLTESAIKALGGAAQQRGTSFITQTVFDGWRAAHPEWRVVEAADRTADGAPMIEVPKVTVGGFDVGPVWFTWRPDRAFHEWMAQWMDKPTEGALGGSAFHTLRITVDWIRGRAAFER